MSRLVKTPVNQILHTNVAVVRMKIQKAVFEIACYKNKVMSWRKGIEKDLDEVVQIDTVFTNVSKGEAAKKSDLLKYFNTSDTREVCKIILREGELQVSPKERELMYESMFKDIVTIITNKCINPDTQRPYPGGVIERALKEQIHFSVKPSKGTKQQALEAIRKLKKKIPIERANMRLKCTLSGKENVRKLRQLFKNANKEEEQVKIEQDDYDQDSETANIVCLVDPGLYRDIFDLIQEDGEVQVLDTSVSEEGDTTIDEIEEAEENKAEIQEESPEAVEEDHDDEESKSISKKSKKKESAVEGDKSKKSKKEKKSKETSSQNEMASDEEEKTTKKTKKKPKSQKPASDEELEETKNVNNETDEEKEPSSVTRPNKKDKKKAKKNKNQNNDNSDDEKPPKKEDVEELSDDVDDTQPKRPSKKELKKAKKNKQALKEEEISEEDNDDTETNEEIPKTKPTRKERKQKKGNQKNVETDE